MGLIKRVGGDAPDKKEPEAKPVTKKTPETKKAKRVKKEEVEEVDTQEHEEEPKQPKKAKKGEKVTNDEEEPVDIMNDRKIPIGFIGLWSDKIKFDQIVKGRGMRNNDVFQGLMKEYIKKNSKQ